MNIIFQKRKFHEEVTSEVLNEWEKISSFYRLNKDNKKENIEISSTTANRIRLCLKNPDKVKPLIENGEFSVYDYQGLISYWEQFGYFRMTKEKLTKALIHSIKMFKERCDEYEEEVSLIATKIRSGKYNYEDEKNFLDQMDIFYIFYHYYYLYVLLSKIR